MQLDGLLFTEDGHGIVVCRRDLFLGNGLQEVLDDRAWDALRPLPINANCEGGLPISWNSCERRKHDLPWTNGA